MYWLGVGPVIACASSLNCSSALLAARRCTCSSWKLGVGLFSLLIFLSVLQAFASTQHWPVCVSTEWASASCEGASKPLMTP